MSISTGKMGSNEKPEKAGNGTADTTGITSINPDLSIQRFTGDTASGISDTQDPDTENSENTGQQQPLKADPVNMATGKFIHEETDYSLPDMAGDYRLIRRYTTKKDRRNQSLGRAWTYNADTHIKKEGKTLTVTMPNGKTAEFTENSGTYTNKRGGSKKYELKKQNSRYIFRDNPEEQDYIYDEKGKIQKTRDKNGNTTEYTYGEYGLEKITLATGYSLTFKWENMKISTVMDNAGRTVKYKYRNGLLTTVERCDGTEMTYTYDKDENLKTITDASGCTYIENTYDEKGRVTEQKTAGKKAYTFTYNEETKTNTITEEESGAATAYTYDKRYDVIKIKYPDGSEEKTETDQYGNPSKHTDRCGAETTYEYDQKGNLIKEKAPSGLITYYEYENGRNTKIKDNSGRQTTIRYDENGNITEKRTLLDSKTKKENITQTEYDSYGRITKITENETAVTTCSYKNTFPRPCSITDPEGTTTILKYDTAGRLAEKNTEGEKETYTYTEYNKIKTYTDAEGGTTSYYYDEAWRMVKEVTPALNRTGTEKDSGKTYGYDEMDRLITETDESGRTTRYKRNTYGDIIRVRKCGTEENAVPKTDSSAESITYEYDICHRIIKKQAGKYGCEKYIYDNCGRIIEKSIQTFQEEPEKTGAGYIYERDKAG